VASASASLPDLALAAVRLRARRRAAWLGHLWSQREGGGPMAVTHAEAADLLDDADAPDAEAAWCADALDPSFDDALAHLDAALADDERLALLARVFGLDRAEQDLVVACLAADADPALGRLFAYLQDHAGRPFVTEPLVARLFGHGRAWAGPPDSAVRRWRIVEGVEIGPGEPAALVLDPTIGAWLRSEAVLDPALDGVARLVRPHPPLERWPVEETAARIEAVVGADGRARVQVAGAGGSGRRTFAACVAETLGLPLLALDTGAVADWDDVGLRAQRQAYLDRSALAWHGDAALRRRSPAGVPPFPVQFVVTGAEAGVPPAAEVVDLRVDLPAPGLDERRALWHRLVPQSAAWPEAEVERLARQHRATVGDVVAAAARPLAGPGEAAEAVRRAQRERLGALARPLPCPFGWDDLVVPEPLAEALADLAFEARERVAFWEQPAARRLFPQGRGLVALFAGPSGTGKTMAAQVVAGELGLDLFRVDLSAVVSKYVGETSQNLARVFAEAAHMDAVLFFDEADALFGKRTEIRDAHDRFANTDTNYLLQALEGFDGVAVLATNKKANLDAAFVRRLRYVLTFPRPEAAERLAIWQRVLGELAGPDTLARLNGTTEVLAEAVDVTGAQIKGGVLGGLFAARRARQPLALEHLMRGLDRELAKSGQALSDRERGRLHALDAAA
jgi:hypothetical protein